LVVLGFETRASLLLDRHFTTWAISPALATQILILLQLHASLSWVTSHTITG
jgi:hypothetical protein